MLSEKFFGADISKFLAYVLVIEESNQNESKIIAKSSVSSYKDLITNEKIRYIDLAIPYLVCEVINKTETELRNMFIDSLKSLLKKDIIKKPKGFESDEFIKYMTKALESI